MITKNNLQGPTVSHPAQAAVVVEATTPTTTTVTHTGTSEVDSLRDMATTKGSQCAIGGDDVDANRKRVNSSL
jgi:hypothetical protein